MNMVYKRINLRLFVIIKNKIMPPLPEYEITEAISAVEADIEKVSKITQVSPAKTAPVELEAEPAA